MKLKITEMVGNTPIVKIGNFGSACLWAKLEGQNPTGSLKDRTAAAIVQKVVAPNFDKTLIDASSGSFACALAYYGRLANTKVTVVVNSKISNDNLAFLRVMGADVIQHGTVTGESRQFCLDLIEKEPEKWFFTDQLTNPIAPKVHEETTAVEITRDLPNIKAIVGSKGSGATLCGVARHIAKLKPDTLVFGSIGYPDDEKKIAGTYVEGADFISPFIIELDASEYYSGDIPVTYRQAMNRCAKLPILVGPQGGGVYEASIAAIERHNITGDVVMIMGDTLLKNVSRF